VNFLEVNIPLGIVIVFGSTLFWLMQSNPYAEPSLSHVTDLTQVVANHTQWQKAFERSFADFLPLLPLGSKIQVDCQTMLSKYWVVHLRLDLLR
jgi:hypothetical protein